MSINIRQGEAEDGGFILDGDIHITKRELEALIEVAKGRDNEEAAKNLGISYTTLRNHTYNVMKKLGAKNRTQALVKAIESGMIFIGIKYDDESRVPGNYFLCIDCGRAFDWGDIVMIHEETLKVNHVLLNQPDWPKCPYEDCDVNAEWAYNWEKVRYHHPEYPKVPEKNVVYKAEKLHKAEAEREENINRLFMEGKI